jgi:hypothetical protein
MASNANPGNQWERVAAELRACREAQHRAWGDLDDAMLGRYLAGEVNGEERRQIESALDELPELRKLTELVRDVLGEFEIAASEPAAVPQSVPYGPATLPFAAYQAKPKTAAAGGAWRPSGPVASWPERVPAARYRRRAGLVAAAILLLALGITLPHSGMMSPPAGQPVAMSQPVALRGEEPLRLVLGGMARVDSENVSPRPLHVSELDQRVERVDELRARISASVQDLEKQGKKIEAEMLARQYASNLTRIAMFDQKKGDLARAELAYNEACVLCARTLGPDAPETIRTRNSLADVYEVALNTSSVDLSRVAGASDFLTFSESFASEKEVDEKNDGSSPMRNNPVAGSFRGKVGVTKMMPSPPSASPARSLPPVRSRSAYEPTAQAAPKQRVHSSPGRKAYSYHAANPPDPNLQHAALVLHDRIISQRQTELKNSVVPVLTQALRESKNPAERQRFALALGRLGPAARESVGGLLDCYHQAKGTSERATILYSLAEIGPSAEQVLPVFVNSLRSDSPEVRNCAARAVVQFGPAAREAVRKLVLERPADKLLRDVLVKIDGPEGRCGIDDESGCFSIKAIHQTQREIHHLATTFRLEIRVETSDEPVRVVAQKSEDRPHAYVLWLYERDPVPAPTELNAEGKKRTREVGEYGVYLHINKDAPDAQVYVSDALQARGLTGKQLRDVMEPHLRSKEFDRGLREGVRFLARFEREHGAK